MYPEQGKRSLPDLWFERQIYRRDGETIRLPAGTFSIEYGRGPEYLRKRISLSVPFGTPTPITLSLERWVKPDQYGYYSGDTHIHAAGCAHYESPYEGVTPEVMFRQVQGEALDVGDVLTWAPGYYYQKRFFSGHVRQFSRVPEQSTDGSPEAHGSFSVNSAMLRYDIEVSGFPSSHCGHLVLLRLAEQNYPGTTTLDEWPSWNLPILKWAKAQGAVAGYAHSAGGLSVDSTELPNYLMPRFDSSGANEYIVDVTHGDLIDFISGCDLWPFAELNIWYHALNCGFRTSFAGETDFPCLRTSMWAEDAPTLSWMCRLPETRATATGYLALRKVVRMSEMGEATSLLSLSRKTAEQIKITNSFLKKATDVHVTAKVCARLEPEIDDGTEKIRKASPYDRPYWHLERSRIGTSRSVPVELIVNGLSVQRKEIEADGTLQAVEFDVSISQSSWLALRILPSSHTNPIMVLVDRAPVRASKKSAEWCRKAVDICCSKKP